jgi:hypothetical protein
VEIYNWGLAGAENRCEGENLLYTTLKHLGRGTLNPGSPHGLHKEMHYLHNPPFTSLTYLSDFLVKYFSVHIPFPQRETLHRESLRLQSVKSPVYERLSRIQTGPPRRHLPLSIPSSLYPSVLQVKDPNLIVPLAELR